MVDKSAKNSTLYNFYQLPVEEQELLEELCSYISEDACKCLPRDEKQRRIEKLWDGSVFREFIGEADDFQKILENKGIRPKAYLNIPSSGISPKTAIRIFCLAADFHEISLSLYLKKYIQLRNMPKYKGKLQRRETYGTLKNDDEISNIAFYDDIIKPRLDDYIERRYTVEKIQAAINNKAYSSGFICIEGEPGSGKTTVLANTVESFLKGKDISDVANLVWHFNSVTRHDNRTLSFIDTLYNCLSEEYDLSSVKSLYQRQQTDNAVIISNLIPDILNCVSLQIDDQEAPRPLLIIIDALDEVDKNDLLKLRVVRENTLGIPQKLPKHVYCLISSRSFKNERYHNIIESISYTSEDKHQQEEVRDYITAQAEQNKDVKSWIAKYQLELKTFVDSICESSRYSFIYLYYVFNDIHQYELESLPKNIDEYYEIQIDRLLSDRHIADPEIKVCKKRILAGIQYFERISMQRLADFCSLSHFSIVEKYISDWINLKIIVTDNDTGFFVRFYHKSFYDFIEKSSYPDCQEIVKISRDDIDYYGCHSSLLQTLHTLITTPSTKSATHLLANNDIAKELYTLALEQSLKLHQTEYLYDFFLNATFCKALIKFNIRNPEKLLHEFEGLCETIKEYDHTQTWENVALLFIKTNMSLEDPAITSQNFALAYPQVDREFPLFLSNNLPIE